MTTFELLSNEPMSDESQKFDARKTVKEYYVKKAVEGNLTQAKIDKRDDDQEPQGNAFWRLLWRHRDGK